MVYKVLYGILMASIVLGCLVFFGLKEMWIFNVSVLWIIINYGVIV